MIKIGSSSEVTAVNVGSIPVDQIYYDSTKVWPTAAPETTLSISPTTITINPGDSSQGYINVTTNASSWNVASSDSGTLSVTKYSSTQVFWTVGNNNTTSNRNFTITVTANEASAQTTVLQYPGYVIYVVGGSDPRSMTNTGGSVAIRIVSQYGSSNQPITVTTSQSWCTATYSSVDNTSHTYTYYLTFTRNDGAERNVTITFAQTTGGHSTGIMFTQAAAAPDIEGVTSKAKYGNWVLGEWKASEGAGITANVPVNGIVLLTTDTLTSDVVVRINIGVTRTYVATNQYNQSQYLKTSDLYTLTNITQTVTTTSQVTISSGRYYGVYVTLPNTAWQKTGTDNYGGDTYQFVASQGSNLMLTPALGQEANSNSTEILSVQ